MNNLEIHTSDSLHYAFPFYIVGLLLMVGYAGAHPYIKNYCKGRLWVSVLLKISFVLFLAYNVSCYCDWFGTSLTTRKWGLWGLLYEDTANTPIYGNVLMTSFCGLFTMFLPIILIFNKQMTISRFCFPIGLLGGIVASIPFITRTSDDSIWRSMLFSNMGSPFRHLWLMVVCFIGLLNTPRYCLKKDWKIYLSGITMCYLYGVVVAFAIIPADSRQMIFGIFSLDFTDGSYKMVGDLIPIYPLNMILVMLFSVGTPIGLVALKEVCFQKIPYYRDVPPIFKKIRSIQQKK